MEEQHSEEAVSGSSSTSSNASSGVDDEMFENPVLIDEDGMEVECDL
jgi:hypothetical protein